MLAINNEISPEDQALILRNKEIEVAKRELILAEDLMYVLEIASDRDYTNQQLEQFAPKIMSLVTNGTIKSFMEKYRLVPGTVFGFVVEALYRKLRVIHGRRNLELELDEVLYASALLQYLEQNYPNLAHKFDMKLYAVMLENGLPLRKALKVDADLFGDGIEFVLRTQKFIVTQWKRKYAFSPDKALQIESIAKAYVASFVDSISKVMEPRSAISVQMHSKFAKYFLSSPLPALCNEALSSVERRNVDSKLKSLMMYLASELNNPIHPPEYVRMIVKKLVDMFANAQSGAILALNSFFQECQPRMMVLGQQKEEFFTKMLPIVLMCLRGKTCIDEKLLFLETIQRTFPKVSKNEYAEAIIRDSGQAEYDRRIFLSLCRVQLGLGAETAEFQANLQHKMIWNFDEDLVKAGDVNGMLVNERHYEATRFELSGISRADGPHGYCICTPIMAHIRYVGNGMWLFYAQSELQGDLILRYKDRHVILKYMQQICDREAKLRYGVPMHISLVRLTPDTVANNPDSTLRQFNIERQRSLTPTIILPPKPLVGPRRSVSSPNFGPTLPPL